ncbi:MAG: type I restriction endonuclease subunit R [Candidatus Heimdallarchaeaceae archaeon]
MTKQIIKGNGNFDLSEYQTRISRIDVMLREQNWILPKRKMSIPTQFKQKGVLAVAEPRVTYGRRINVIEEVDTKQSDFKIRDYKTVNETLRNDLESKYADYLLLDDRGDPLAIVEAKRTSKDPILGQKQAEEYADDIKKQTGKDVFIFLTNGYEIWFWNRPYENPRLVKGFHSQEALERIRFQNNAKKKLRTIPIKKEIIDRPYQIEACRRVLEGIEKGKRKFLIVQATGTGKTRVAMALVDVLLRANRAQKFLFLADRKVLRDQAYDSFKQWFPHESKSKIFSGTLDKNSRLYVSTIQTFMECYQEFSPGDFDVIISDEAHRSIYNKWKDVFTYFDSVQIGLTATPADLIDRDTFRFFECQGKVPTFLYSFDQAVKEGYLVDFKVHGAQTHFQIAGIKPEDIPDRIKKKLLEEGMEEDELIFEGSQIEKKVIVKGTNEALVKEFMDNCIMDQTGTLPAKTIFFAVSKKHAKRLWEAFEKLYPEYRGRLVRVITSEDSRARELIDDFKNKSMPRIAISVDMLDTGVDVPEVCNLVFAKPVFSKIKFWQMIGRGTRADATCKYREWLPSGKKEDFLIFDFWNNFEYFNLNPEGKKTSSGEAITTRIFKVRLLQLEHFLKKGNKEYAELYKQKIQEDIGSLPKKSVAVKEHIREVETALSANFWDKVGKNPIQYLREKITPLLRYKTDVNLSVASFTLFVERLGLAILQKNNKEIERLRESIGDYLWCLPDTLQQIKAKKELLDKVRSKHFWENISYKDTLMLFDEFAELMRYKRKESRKPIELDIDDVVEQRKLIEFGPHGEADYIDSYREKVEKKIKQLAEVDPTIKKIEEDKVLTEQDLEKLEKTLNSPTLYITEENLQKIYAQHKGTLVQFIKKILGMYKFPEPKKRIEEEFKTFMVEHQFLNADQINFMRTLQTVFLKKKHIEYKDFFDLPFSNIPNAPLPLFDEETLKELTKLCSTLENELFTKHGVNFGLP